MTAAIAIAVTACEPPNEPLPLTERRLLVQSVLDLGTRRQTISVRWTGPTVSFFDEAVQGATVSITGPNGIEMIAAEDTGTPNGFRRGNYHLDLDRYGATLVPGGIYDLRVATATGEEASGRTTVPGAGPAIADTALRSFRRSSDTLRLAWPRVSGARSYYVTIRGRDFNFAVDNERYSAFADTAVTLSGRARWFDDDIFIPGDTVTVFVAAVDDNHYTYYHTTVDPFAGAPPTRLTGAVGVFGSLVPLIRRRYVVTN